MSLFVVGCFTPEFQDIYDGDLDGYLLIGSGGDIDGSYLPRKPFPESVLNGWVRSGPSRTRHRVAEALGSIGKGRFRANGN